MTNNLREPPCLTKGENMLHNGKKKAITAIGVLIQELVWLLIPIKWIVSSLLSSI